MGTSRLRHIVFRFAALLISVVFAGCTTTTPLVMNDNGVFQPSLSASFNLSETEKAASHPQTGHAIEIAVVKEKGGSTQSLASGQAPIIFSGKVFSAPQQLRNEFDMTHTSVSWRWRKFFRERALGLEVTTGLGYSSVGLAVSSSTQSASGRAGEYGPQAGVALIWRTESGSSVHARVSGFLSGASKFSREELFYDQPLGQNVSVRAGYAHWKVTNSDTVFGVNDFEMNFSGPTVNLGLNF